MRVVLVHSGRLDEQQMYVCRVCEDDNSTEWAQCGVTSTFEVGKRGACL